MMSDINAPLLISAATKPYRDNQLIRHFSLSPKRQRQFILRSQVGYFSHLSVSEARKIRR